MDRFEKSIIPALVLSLSIISIGPAMAADEVKPAADSKKQVDSKIDSKADKKDLPETGSDSKQESGSEELSNPTNGDLKKLYDSGNYRGVLKAVKKMKPNMMTHYYTGLAYQATNERYKAAVEYNYVKLHAKDAKLKYNASAALKAVYSKRYHRKRRENSYDRQERMDSYARYPDQTGDYGGPRDNFEALLEAQERAKKRRPTQDRFWRNYQAPRSKPLK